MDNSITPVLPVGGSESGFGGFGGIFMIFAIVAILLFGGGGFSLSGNNGNSNAIQNDVQGRVHPQHKNPRQRHGLRLSASDKGRE